MTSDLAYGIKSLVQLWWHFLVSIQIPGTTWSIAYVLIGLFVANLGLRFLFSMLGISVSSEDIASAEDHKLIKRKDKPRKIGF